MGLINISVNSNLSDSFGNRRGSLLMQNAENKIKNIAGVITNFRFLHFSLVFSLFDF